MPSDKAIIYLIRHGEKPAQGDTLSAQGLQRAQCLRKVFGADSKYDIRYIMAEKPKKDGGDQRPKDTITPLAQDLGIDIDTSCKRDDSKGVAKVVDHYNGPGNILICWEHHHLTDIVEAITDDKHNKCEYPDERFDLIWTLPPPYKDGVQDVTSEDCAGLDDGIVPEKYKKCTD